MIKIDIISGFLGAGKTTLIKKLFGSSIKNEKVIIIENEFGQENIDSSFLKGYTPVIKEINAGCICCSLVTDFEQAIEELAQTYNPTRIVIEPSGVGKLSDIVKAVKTVEHIGAQVNSKICVVDSTKAHIYNQNFGEFYEDQIKNADKIFLTKMEKLDAEGKEFILNYINNLNPTALKITTSVIDLASEKLLEIIDKQSNVDSLVEEEHHCDHHHHHGHECTCGHHHEDEEHECSCGHHHEEDHECTCGGEHHHHHHHDHECSCGHHHHDADEIFETFTINAYEDVSKENLEIFLKSLEKLAAPSIILRSKGILKSVDNWIYFDYVAGDFQINDGEADISSRLVIIGSNLDKEKITTLFKEICQ